MGCKEGGKKILLPASKRETENRKCLPTEHPAGVLLLHLVALLPWLVWWQTQLKRGHKRSFQSKSRPSGASPCGAVGIGRRDVVKSFSWKLFSRGVCWDHPLPTGSRQTNPSEPQEPVVTSLSRSVPQWHPSMVQGAEPWSPKASPKKRHPPCSPSAPFALDLKAPNTPIHQARRMRHPGLALHTRKPRAEGWWQVQETPGVLVLSPAHWSDQTPQQLHEPRAIPKISKRSHKPLLTLPSAPKYPKSQRPNTFPRPFPPAQEGPSDGSSLGNQHIPNQPARPRPHHRHTWIDSSLCY